MFPVLFAIGPFTLKTMSVFLLLGFLVTSFVFWRRGREEHYREDQLFDGFLFSALLGAILARVGFVVINFQQFGGNVLHWLDVVGHPGFNGTVGLMAAGWYLYRYAHKNKWDTFEILDFGVTGISLGAALIFLGKFFDGSSVGHVTTLPWGVTFPNLFEPRHPVQLYFFIFFILQFWYLGWVEYHYRTFSWYRSGKKTAQTGFLVSLFVISTALFSALMSFLQDPLVEIAGFNVDRLVSLGVLGFGLVLLYVRSGRVLPFSREHKKRKALQNRLVNKEIV